MWSLFFNFFRIGLFTYGGGLAILVLLQEEAIALGWLTAKEFADMIAISQSTPGPIAINLATFVGYVQEGVGGVLIASIAVVIPGFVLSYLIARFMSTFNQKPVVKSLMKGLRGIVIGLIVVAIINISMVTLLVDEPGLAWYQSFDLKSILLLIAILIAIKLTDQHPIIYIVIAGVIGAFLY